MVVKGVKGTVVIIRRQGDNGFYCGRTRKYFTEWLNDRNESIMSSSRTVEVLGGRIAGVIFCEFNQLATLEVYLQEFG
ncbi:hypothetical protein CEXT_240081 [Caerostris extrusa]|uniref:Uncharacterized protein n=1 Tax=Caerostris extrusa TaxID=172846 RepID=A0AAV4PSS4_CAEEX|nr:hypothetical protein CEXT_240081 [Caerostris extrusa]